MLRVCVGWAAPDGGRRSLPYNAALIAVLELREAHTESLNTRERIHA
jgi:hypothetical protein